MMENKERKVIKTEIFESVVVKISDKTYDKKLWLEQLTFSDGSIGFQVKKEITKRSPSQKSVTVANISHTRN